MTQQLFCYGFVTERSIFKIDHFSILHFTLVLIKRYSRWKGSEIVPQQYLDVGPRRPQNYKVGPKHTRNYLNPKMRICFLYESESWAKRSEFP